MAASQPFGFSCKGGLNTNISKIELLSQPGIATKLLNFEVDPEAAIGVLVGLQLMEQAQQQGPTEQTLYWASKLTQTAL